MEKIDLVITYVNSNDSEWQKLYKQYAPNINDLEITGKQRFRENICFKYYFRGIESFVPWINKVFLVVQSKSQVPSWINQNTVKVVLHEDFIPKEHLPVFNSQAIEMFLWNIPGLSEKFLYSNDDTYFVGPLKPEDFFEDGKIKTTFARISLNGEMPLWKKAIINSGLLANKKEQQSLLSANSYITPTHTIRPYFKSKMIELYNNKKQEINSSITKFRDEKNYTVYLYDFYLKSLGLVVNKTYKSAYHSSNASIGLIANTLINPDLYKIICINDTTEEYDLKREQSIEQQFNKNMSKKSNYET